MRPDHVQRLDELAAAVAEFEACGPSDTAREDAAAERILWAARELVREGRLRALLRQADKVAQHWADQDGVSAAEIDELAVRAGIR